MGINEISTGLQAGVFWAYRRAHVSRLPGNTIPIVDFSKSRLEAGSREFRDGSVIPRLKTGAMLIIKSYKSIPQPAVPVVGTPELRKGRFRSGDI